MNDAWFYRIKAAQRDLIKFAGGIERAAEVTSISKSQVGRWNNPGDTDLMPLSAVLQLEAETGKPLITQVMAESSGRKLADTASDDAGCGSLLASYSETIRQAGELMATGARAFADGNVSPAEAVAIDRAAHLVEGAVAELRRTVSVAQARGGEAAKIQLVKE